MSKTITVDTVHELSINLHKQGKTIVLAGGCFDILHLGHIRFLEKAKEQGDILIVFLESDERIQQIKGHNRPINPQKDRAEILAALTTVDYIVLLPSLMTDDVYDELVKTIKPAIIAITEADPYREHKVRQAKITEAQLVTVIQEIHNQSTSKIMRMLSEDL